MLTQPADFSKEFTAKVGANADVVESRKNCQLNIKIDFDPGFSFAIYSADYAGWADLDAGVTGTIKSTYYFSGETDQVCPRFPPLQSIESNTNSARQTSVSSSLSGPFHGKYYKQDNVPVVQWSPCGGDAMFNVNSEVALTPLASAANGLLAATREGGRFTNNLYFAWKKC